MSDAFAPTGANPGTIELDPGSANAGSPNEAVVEPVKDADQPTGTAMDLAIEDEFPGDPLAAAMDAILSKRFAGEEEADAAADAIMNPPAVEPPPPDPTDPGPDGPRVENQPAPESPATKEPVADPGAEAGAVAAAPAPPDAGGDIPVWKFGNESYTAEQVQYALELAKWDASLTPQQVVAINEFLEGRAQFAPLGSSPVAPAPGPASGGVGSPTGAGTPTAPVGNPPAPAPAFEYDPDDPVQAQIAALTGVVQQTAAQQQAFLEAQQAQQQAQIAEARRAQIVAAVDTAKTSFGAQYGLGAEDVEQLAIAAGQLQIIPALQAKHNGNIEASMQEALEVALWSNPELRTQIVQAQAQTQTDDALATSAALDERRRLASSISGRGAPPPRTAPAPQLLTKEQRLAAMTAEVANHLEQ